MKGNQGDLHETVEQFFTRSRASRRKPRRSVGDWLFDEGVLARPIQHWQCQSRVKEHGRLEIRRCFVVEARTAWLTEEQLKAWPGLSRVACVESERTIRGKATIGQCYFLTSLSIGTKGESLTNEILRGVRSHWSIENNLHKKTAQAVSLTGFWMWHSVRMRAG